MMTTRRQVLPVIRALGEPCLKHLQLTGSGSILEPLVQLCAERLITPVLFVYRTCIGKLIIDLPPAEIPLEKRAVAGNLL